MRLLHLADLHLGKRLHGHSLMEDQASILSQVSAVADRHAVDALLLCGDIYDKTIPSLEAVGLLDRFLSEQVASGREVFLIAGNHDSPARLDFGRSLFAQTGIHIAAHYSKALTPVSLRRGKETLAIFMLPFLKAYEVQAAYPEKRLESQAEIFRQALAPALAHSGPKLLMAHQFVMGALESDSERLTVGGLDAIPVPVFDGFDYVALGHLHRPQALAPHVRYAGSPLAYSASEAGQEKSLPLLTVENGQIDVTLLPLRAPRPLAVLEGSLEDILAEAERRGLHEAYLFARLTQYEAGSEIAKRLRHRFPKLCEIRFQTKAEDLVFQGLAERPEAEAIEALFASFFARERQADLNERQVAIVERLAEAVRREALACD